MYAYHFSQQTYIIPHNTQAYKVISIVCVCVCAYRHGDHISCMYMYQFNSWLVNHNSQLTVWCHPLSYPAANCWPHRHGNPGKYVVEPCLKKRNSTKVTVCVEVGREMGRERERKWGRGRERDRNTRREKLSSEGESEGGRERRGGEQCITSTVHVCLFTCPCTDTAHCPKHHVR